MIVENCLYDPVRDLQPVDQFGFIDLKVALDKSCIPSQLPDSETDYNGIDEPQQVAGKPRDIFEAMDSQRALEAAAAAAEAEKKDE